MTTTKRQVFRLRLGWRVWCLALLPGTVPLLAATVVTGFEYSKLQFWGAMAVFGVSCAISLMFVGRFLPPATVLTVSDQGLEYRSPEIRIRAPWAHVLGSGERQLDGFSCDGLILQASGAANALQAQASFLPLSTFDSEWKRGPIGAAIARHSPQALRSPADDRGAGTSDVGGGRVPAGGTGGRVSASAPGVRALPAVSAVVGLVALLAAAAPEEMCELLFGGPGLVILAVGLMALILLGSDWP